MTEHYNSFCCQECWCDYSDCECEETELTIDWETLSELYRRKADVLFSDKISRNMKVDILEPINEKINKLIKYNEI